MNENKFGNISPRAHSERPQKTKSSNEKKLNRREFLVAAGATVANIAIGKTLQKFVESEREEHKIQNALDAVRDRIEERREMEATQEQQIIQRADRDVVGKTFEEQILTQDTITIDAPTKEAIYHAWREKYKPGSIEYRESILAGLDRMKPWIAEIKEVFAQYDVPEDLIYLGIVESHFLNNAVSEASAVGPYQATGDTAQRIMPHISMNGEFDERRDPIISAEICAKHLRDSYERFGDWNLALMDYNGGFTNSYLLSRNIQEESIPLDIRSEYEMTRGDTLSSIAQKFNTSVTLLKRANNLHSSQKIRRLRPGEKLLIPQEREKLTMEGFNTWLEDHINMRIKNAMEGPDYVIQPGDTVNVIAQKFGISREIIMSLNNLKPGDTIYAGKPLTLPEDRKKKRALLTKTVLHHYHENINYPEKFYAIRDVIKENNLDQVFDDAKKEYRNVSTPQINRVTLKHTVKKDDNLTKIAHTLCAKLKKTYPKFDKSEPFIQRVLMQQNPRDIPNKDTVRQGKLILNIAIQKPPTLQDIAHKYNVPIEKLSQLNPAASSAHAHIPEQKKVRIPR
jgi:LysM repeat protein